MNDAMSLETSSLQDAGLGSVTAAGARKWNSFGTGSVVCVCDRYSREMTWFGTSSTCVRDQWRILIMASVKEVFLVNNIA